MTLMLGLGGPRGPLSPCRPAIAGPAGPAGPASPLGPAGPRAPGSPLSQAVKPTSNTAARTKCVTRMVTVSQERGLRSHGLEDQTRCLGITQSRASSQSRRRRGDWSPLAAAVVCRSRTVSCLRFGGLLLRWADTNRNQRRRIWHLAAGGTSLAKGLRPIARRPAVSRHQHLVELALHGTVRNTVRPNDPDARTGRTRRPSFALWAWRSRRSGGTGWTRIARGTLRSGQACIALRALAAGCQADEQHRRQNQMRHTHGHGLTGKRSPISRVGRSNSMLG